MNAINTAVAEMRREAGFALATACLMVMFPLCARAGDLDDLKAAQGKLESAFAARDVNSIVALLHRAYVDFPADGESPVDWSARTDLERQDHFRDLLDRYETWEAKVQDAKYSLAGTTGIVSGWERVSRKPKGGVLEFPRWRFTATWAKSGAKWLLIATHRSTTPATTPGAAPAAQDLSEDRILRTALGVPRWANVPLVDARLLRVLAEASGARHVVELGTSTGFSALWFCDALRKTGGHLTTFEIDPGRAKIARERFQQAGVDGLVTLAEGDAHSKIATLSGPIDIVFIDAEKDGYLDYIEKLLPLVKPGGLVLAHNMRWPAPSQAYVKAVTSNPALETVFVNMDDQGIGITLKKR